jgi:hypothetical protein
MNLAKHKRIRLTGKPAAALNEAIHERDNYRCIVPGCRHYVPIGEKWHHEPCGSNKEDVIEKGCLLCYTHHEERESKDGAPIKRACEDYLNRIYPDRNQM